MRDDFWAFKSAWVSTLRGKHDNYCTNRIEPLLNIVFYCGWAVLFTGVYPKSFRRFIVLEAASFKKLFIRRVVSFCNFTILGVDWACEPFLTKFF